MARSIRMADGVAWRAEGSGFLLYDIARDTVCRGNAEGLIVLECCEAGLTIAEMARELTARRHVDASTAVTDITRFVERLVDAGAAVWADETV